MSPLLNEGDYVVAKALLPDDQLHVDDIVIFDHPDVGPVVKSVKTFKGTVVQFCGQSPLSMGSDEMGWIARDRITRKVILLITSTGIKKIDKKTE
tara:strand:- start:759 stop:1043 length:285 start_codon:yes stop_codon:yes gene_type:complete